MLKIISYYCSVGKDRKIMELLRERYGKWALVAGAAEGIGEGFTTVLAANGFNVVLVDRNAYAMHVLSVKIMERYHVETAEVEIDLAATDAADQCMRAASSAGCRLMVYVAAYSKVSRFKGLDTPDLDAFISVNTRTLLHLVHGFSNMLTSEGKTGGIVLVSSLAGMIG
ncbi:MAG: SDR family NAD(P)-dependent oxidoreductase, partial [Bacteroidota bacterium]